MIIKNHSLFAALALFLLLLPVLAYAQTAAEMDSLLGADTVSAARAARFVLGSAELLPGGLSGPEAEKAAYDTARSKGWIKTDSGADITLKDSAFLVMKAFNIKGGVMYSLFKNHRYAYREMISLKLIPGIADPGMKVTGSRLLHILDRTMSYTGEYGGAQ